MVICCRFFDWRGVAVPSDLPRDVRVKSVREVTRDQLWSSSSLTSGA